jgi:virginiamycin B lyase
MFKYPSLIASGIVLLSMLGSHAWADITEFELPNPNSGPGPMIAGPDGNLWFTEHGPNGNRVGRFSLADSTITEFDLPNPNSLPRGLAVGADNNVWFAEYNANRIGMITPDGQITEFARFLFDQGSYTTLDPPGSTTYTKANGVNAAGQIVGSYEDVGGGWHGFLATPLP